MNKYMVLLFLFAGCSFQLLSGQAVFTRDALLKAKDPVTLMQQSIALKPLVTKPRNIADDARTIKQAGIDPAEQMDYVRKQCPLLQAIKPKLELKGDRLNTETVNLDWRRENGIDDRLYFIERSINDTLHFETVNNVWAYNRQKLNEKYSLPDDNPYEEISFYRLKLATFSNEIYYSNIVKVKGYAVETFTAYPNPAAREVRLKLLTNVSGPADVLVYDDAGKRLLQKKVMMIKGSNDNNLHINNLLPGTYFVTILLADKSIRKGKIIKE